MKKQYQQLIDIKMKMNGFKKTSGFYYVKTNGLMFILNFNVYKKELIAQISCKKIAYDDILWNIIDKPKLSKGSDAQRIVGAFHCPDILLIVFRKGIDDNNFSDIIREIISDVIEYVDKEKKEIDLNRIIIEGNYSSSLRCIALLEDNRIADAINLSQHCVENGDLGGISVDGKYFHIRVLEKYGKNLNVISENSSNTMFHTDIILDRIDWHFDTAKNKYCEDNYIISEETLTNEDKEIIEECAGVHIAYYITWLIEKGGLVLNDDLIIYEVKNRMMTGAQVLIKCLDGKLTNSNISDEYRLFSNNYYEKLYYQDYADYLDQIKADLFDCPFDWKRYEAIKDIIDRRMFEFNNNNL